MVFMIQILYDKFKQNCWRLAVWSNVSDIRNASYIHFSVPFKKLQNYSCVQVGSVDSLLRFHLQAFLAAMSAHP